MSLPSSGLIGEPTGNNGASSNTEPDAAKPDKDQAKPLNAFYGRYGTFMLVVDEMPKDRITIVESLEAALRGDNRVTSILEFEKNPEWITSERSYPDSRRGDTSLALSGREDFRNVRFSPAIFFRVSVPAKNQPSFKGNHDITSDEYFVGWDGVSAVVLWPHPEKCVQPIAGGHVVIDVLRDVARSAGYRLYDQACNPYCTNIFAHRVLHVEQYAGEAGVTEISSPAIERVDIRIEKNGDGADVTTAIMAKARQDLRSFARYKNLARHIRDLEDLARSMVERLLDLEYKSIRRSRLGTLRRALAWWRHRDEGKQARELVASLWLALARIESVRRDWHQLKIRLDESLARHKTELLFVRDLTDDRAALESQDLTFVRAAIEQSAIRKDSRTMIWATLLGAASAILGGIVGSLIA